jgi:hypothetical protein
MEGWGRGLGLCGGRTDSDDCFFGRLDWDLRLFLGLWLSFILGLFELGG